jgi:hypothetical protein
MLKTVAAVFLISVFCIQQQYNIKRVYLFSKTQYSGNVHRNVDGSMAKGYNKTLICFVEVDKDKPSPLWNTAYFDGYKYTVNIVPLNQDSVLVGNKINTHNAVVIKPITAGQLLQLGLTIGGKCKNPDTKSFVLEGTLNNKKVYYKTDEPVTELAPVLMQ